MLITPEMLEKACTEKAIIRPWGYEEYRRNANGEMVLDHLLITDDATQTSRRVYLDGRPTETFKWGGTK